MKHRLALSNTSGRAVCLFLAIFTSVTLFCGVSIMFDDSIVNVAHVHFDRSVS